MRIAESTLDVLQSQRGVWVVAAIGFTLALPSLTVGLTTDDHLHERIVAEGRSVLEQFAFSHLAQARAEGALAWWSNPEMSLHFLRPLAALTVVIDYTLWPDAPWLMHLENVLLYAALVAIAWLLYRALLPSSPRVAALAALMFAIDEGHASAVGWISSRNTVMANLFAMAAVLLHVQARAPARSYRGVWHAAAAGCTALALASAEAGLAALAYLFAYALVFEAGALWKRVATLLPELAVVAVWAAVYVTGDYGARGINYYRDLSASLIEGPLDLPTWLLSLLGPNVAGGLLLAPPAIVRALALLLVLPLVAALIRVLPRTRQTLFFALGALACIVPLFATVPQDRVLLTASFGAFGLIATFITHAQGHHSRFLRVTRSVFISIHLVVAPLLFIPQLNIGGPIDRGSHALANAVPDPAPAQVLVLNTPLELVSLVAWELLQKRERGRATPEAMHQLYAGAGKVEVERIDERTLEMRVEGGWARTPLEGIFASKSAMPHPGVPQVLGPMQITVREAEPDGRPRAVQFRFPDPLETPSRLWLEWRGTALHAWQPPPIGETRVLEPLSVLRSFPAAGE